jgi:hypothetical protein
MIQERFLHMVLTKPGVIRPVVISKYAAVPVFIIKNNLRTGGIPRDRFPTGFGCKMGHHRIAFPRSPPPSTALV